MTTHNTREEEDIKQHLVDNFCDGDPSEKPHIFTFAGALDIAKYFYELGSTTAAQEKQEIKNTLAVVIVMMIVVIVCWAIYLGIVVNNS